MTIKDREQFFLKHAGYSWDPKKETRIQGRIRSAQSLARAEVYAYDAITFEWLPEDENPADVFGEADPVNGPFYDPTNDFSRCIARNSIGDVVASLGMIEESKDNRERANYRRVVEAELASEAMPEDTALSLLKEALGLMPLGTIKRADWVERSSRLVAQEKEASSV